MCSRWYGSVLLVTVVLCFRAAVDENLSSRKPYGPKICEELCNRTTRCFTCKFSAFDLSCHIVRVNSRQHSLGPVTKDKEKTKGKKIIHINDHAIQRRLSSRRLPTDMTEDRRQDNLPKLLMLPCNEGPEYLQGRQFVSQNNTVAHYPYIISQCISAVAYIPLNRKLVVANWAVRTLSFLYVDDKRNRPTILKRHTRIKGVTVDSNKYAVFMATSSPQGISAMTTHCKHFRSLVTLPKCILEDIAADLKRSLIYVTCRGEKIHTVTYQGVHKGPLAGPKWVVGPLGINLVEDSLYFVQQSDASVFKMSLSDRIVKKVRKFEREVYAIYATNNSVYVSLLYSRRLYTIHKGRISILTDTGYNEKTVKGVHMCGIP